MSHSNKSFIAGAILGGLIGGAAALLFAPKSGDKMRKDLRKKYKETSEKTKDLVETMTEQAYDLVDQAKEFAAKAKEAAEAVADGLRKK